MDIADGIFFERNSFISARDSPKENNFFDIKSDREYDSRSNVGFTFGKYDIADDASEYVPFDTPINCFDDGAHFKLRSGSVFFIPYRDVLDEGTFFDIKYNFIDGVASTGSYTYTASADAPFNVPIEILDSNGGFNFGYAPTDFSPAEDSPDEGTSEYSKFSTASISIGDGDFRNGTFNEYASKRGKVSHQVMAPIMPHDVLGLFLLCKLGLYLYAYFSFVFVLRYMVT
jgi:hypothetical protein